MGSKISKAVRRPQANATTRTAGITSHPTIGNRHPDNHTKCQEPFLPEIEPSSPLVVDVDNIAVASSLNLQEAATSSADAMDIKSTTPPGSPLYAQDSIGFAPPPFAGLQYIPGAPPPPPGPPPPTPPTCGVCYAKFDKDKEWTSIIYPCKYCGGAYCTTCIKEMFTKACKDLSRMPPRCCNQIQLHHARPYLTKAEAAEFREKYEEWSTPKPFYCPVPTCSAFIPPRLLQQSKNESKGKQRVDSVVGTPTSPFIDCPKCDTGICTNCRDLAHDGRVCNEIALGVDEETAALLKSWGYKKCPKCGNGIRRMYGCNHMGCLCGAHFCWVCLKARDECDGGCYESEDEYTDDEEDEEESGRSRAGENINEGGQASGGDGQAIAQPAEPQATAPQPILRPENLDGRSGRHWEQAGMDFGDEPRDEDADRAWFCDHHFKTAKVSLADSLRNDSSATGMECTKCWSTIHPEIQKPSAMNRVSLDRLVPGNSRDRGGGGGRGRHTGPRFPLRVRRRLLRGDATVGTQSPLSQSFPSEPDLGYELMDGVELRSNNGDRVVDTYGNVITTTDFIMNPDPPRRSSFHFDFTMEPTMIFSEGFDAGPSSASQGFHLHQNMMIDGAADAVNEPKTFSLAYECRHCGVLLCSTCKDDLPNETNSQNFRRRT